MAIAFFSETNVASTLRTATLGSLFAALATAGPLCAQIAPFAPIAATNGLVDVSAGQLAVAWDDDAMPVDERLTNASFLEICESLTRRLAPGRGPSGLGLFSTHGCYRGGRLLAGQDTASPWILLLSRSPTAFEIRLVFDAAASTQSSSRTSHPFVLKRIPLPLSVSPERLLLDAAVAPLLARTLKLALPAVGYLEIGQLPTLMAVAPQDLALTPLALEIVFYTLQFDADRDNWVPRRRGALRRQASPGAAWTLDLEPGVSPKDPVFIGVPPPRARQGAALTAELLEACEALTLFDPEGEAATAPPPRRRDDL